MPKPRNHGRPDVDLHASPARDHPAALRQVCNPATLGKEIFDAFVLFAGSKFQTERNGCQRRNGDAERIDTPIGGAGGEVMNPAAV